MLPASLPILSSQFCVVFISATTKDQVSSLGKSMIFSQLTLLIISLYFCLFTQICPYRLVVSALIPVKLSTTALSRTNSSLISSLPACFVLLYSFQVAGRSQTHLSDLQHKGNERKKQKTFCNEDRKDEKSLDSVDFSSKFKFIQL